MSKSDDTNKLLLNILEELLRRGSSDETVIEELRAIRTAVEKQEIQELTNARATDELIDRAGFGENATDFAEAYRKFPSGVPSVNEMRRRAGFPEAPLLWVSAEVLNVVQETPHMFYERGTRIGRLSERRCQLCKLSFKNPVHLIQMAQLPEE